MIRKILYLIGLFLCFLNYEASATHLVGGNLGYQYLGPVGGGNYRYKITFKTYLDCHSPFWGNGFPEPSLEVGIYEGSANPSGSLPYRSAIVLPLVSSESINPDLPNGCTVGSSSCVYEVVYEEFVNLSTSFLGYYLYYDRCCRNGSIINLNSPGVQANPFYAYIPPTLVNNSSPTFADLPTAFLCVGDTTTILNTAFDPDGDMLIFSFVEPFRGFSTDQNPAPPLPQPNMTWPIPTVNWATNYSYNKPFGTSGYSYINSSTGLTKYKPAIQGDYVVAVEIKEYRNGNLIGITRRDLQYLAVNCPPNQPPVLSQISNSGQTNYSIVEGNQLCFPIIMSDASGQNITLTSNGLIFNPSVVSPTATINTPQSDTGSVTAQFCWTTGCGQASNVPYLFTASATDDGCPPKTTNLAYSIEVKSYTGPTVINGSPVVCQSQSNVAYSVSSLSNATYVWTVTGGNIIGPNTGNSISVNWGNNPGVGEIKVYAISDKGCPSTEIKMDITIIALPLVDAGFDKIRCIKDSVKIGGSPTGPLGSIYSWAPSAGLSASNISNPWAKPSVNTTYVVTVTNGSCSAVDTIKVTVGAAVNAINDLAICLGDSAQLNADTGMVSYIWSPDLNLSDDSIRNPIAQPINTTKYYVTAIDSLGCVSVDSVSLTVRALPTINSGNDSSICAGSSIVIGGNPTGPNGSIYLWSPSSTLNNSGIANPLATPSGNTFYSVLVKDTNNCYNSDSVLITVLPNPVADAGFDVGFCLGDSVQLNASGGDFYSWTPSLSLSNASISNPWANPVNSTDFIVKVSDAFGCFSEDTMNVTVFNLPPVNAGDNIAICIGNSTIIGGTPSGPSGSVYNWSPNTYLDDANLSNPVTNTNVDITYILTVTDTNACINKDTIAIAVNALPEVDAGRDTTVCVGSFFQLGGNPTSAQMVQFLWTPFLNVSDSSLNNPQIQSDSTRYYFITVTDTNGCVNRDSIYVGIYNLPIISKSNDTTICFGDTAFLTATGGTFYSWSPTVWLSDTLISSVFSTAQDTIMYYVTVTDLNTCSVIDSIVVNVNQLPVIDAGPNEWLCPGDAVMLNAVGGVSYLWSPSNGLSDPGIANPVASPSDSTLYYLTVSDINGCVNYDSLYVGINDAVPTFAGNDTTICFGDTAILGGSPTSPNGTIYSWTPTQTLSSSIEANPRAFPSITTTYYLITTNDTCVGYDTVTVFVNQLPTVSAGNDTSICFKDSIQFFASGGLEYYWSTSYGLSDSAIFNPLVYPLLTTEYIVAVKDVNNCTNNDTVLVSVNPLPVANAGNDLGICFNDSIQLLASGGVKYLWMPSSGLSSDTIANPHASPSDTITYIVFVTDSNTCMNSDTISVNVKLLPIANAGPDIQICLNDTALLSASGGVVYSWSPNIAISDSAVNNPKVYPSDTTIYYVVVTDTNTCSQTDSVIVIVNQLPIANAGNDTAFCIGNSVQINATGGEDYAWVPALNLNDTSVASPIASPETTTNYVVFVRDSNLCINTDTIQVEVYLLPNVSAGLDTNICKNDSVVLIAIGAQNYTWSPNTNILFADSSNPLVFPKTSISYYLTGTDTNGCVNLDTIIVSVFRVSGGPDKEICQQDTAGIYVSATDIASFVWSPAESLDNYQASYVIASPMQTTTYNVIGTNERGCTDTAFVEVNVKVKPLAEFKLEITPGCNGVNALFTNTSTDSDSYLWVDKTSLSQSKNYAVLFSYNTENTITLIASSSQQCSDTLSFDTPITNFKDYFDIVVPNVFTPNGDGMNDRFFVNVKNQLADCIEMQIYNRWGEIIFASEGGKIEWDGLNQKGNKVPEGSYFFTISVNGIEFKGILSVLD